jgi:hypothetical protein
VSQAIAAIWVTLAVDALLALFCKLTGVYSDGEFIGALLLYALICIIPYKLGNRSNAARYVYVILTAVCVLMVIPIIGSVKKPDLYVSLILLPVEAFIIYRLFQKEASAWFYSR